MSNKTENEKYFNAKKQTRYHFVADDIQFSQISILPSFNRKNRFKPQISE